MNSFMYSKNYSGEEVEEFVKKLKEELRQANDTIDRLAKESFE